MDSNLNFIDTLTIEQFKAQELVQKVQIKQNDHTGKLFAVYGGKTASVSQKGIPQNPVISLVNPTLTREPNEAERQYIGRTVVIEGQKTADPRANGYFYLIHEESNGGSPILAEF